MGRRKNNSVSEPCEKVAWFTPATLAEDFAGHEYAKDDINWFGGSVESVGRLLRYGDLSSVAEASSIADRINDAVDVAGVRTEWAPDVVGAFPSVPAYLAGDPCNMWARSPVQDERGEITVFIDTCVSADVSLQDMKRRGVCVLAAMLALQRVRNVRAVVYGSIGTCCPAVRLSYPLDVSELCALVTCPQITRRALFGASRARGWRSNRWADWAAPVAGDDVERSAVRRLLGAGCDSVIITPHKMGELSGVTDSEMVNRINGLLHAVTVEDMDAATL